MKNRKKWISLFARIMAAIMLLSLLFSIIPTVSAASSSEIRKQINAMQEQREELKSQKEALKQQRQETEDEIENLISEKYVIDQEITILYQEIALIEEQVAAYRLLIADKQDELEDAQALLADLTDKNRERIRTMEEEGTLSYWAVLFQANSFSDLLDRLNMIEEIAASDQRRLKQMSDAAKEVASAQEDLTVEKQAVEQTLTELDDAQQELEQKRQEAEEIIQTLIAKCDEIDGLAELLEQEDEELLNDIALKEQEYNQAKLEEYLAWLATSETTTAPTEPPTTQPTTAPEGETSTTEAPTETTAPSNNGTGTNNGTGSTGNTSGATWLVPCSYVYVSSPFGDRDQPTAGASTNHKGVDLAAASGTPIYATRSGTVTIARSSSSAGNYVTINHGDGYSSVYMHMTNYVVSVGQSVSAGQLIGYVGSTGISTGPHLHFGITYNGTYVNPALYVNLS